MLSLSMAMILGVQTSDYNGYVRHDYQWNRLSATVVEPKSAAKGRPWIWRTEFFDHRPQLDLAMLAKGYHLVYLNVGNTFGCPSAMQNFTGFYRELMGPKWKLNRRVVLEGFSRGGLYAYNWAVRNPQRVMAIYGDAPVLDFTTWPLGRKGAQRSEGDWNSLVKLYGFPTEQDAIDYAWQPINFLDTLAAAKIPIIHVVGDADEAVPVQWNSNLVEKRYKYVGGTIEVIHKPGGLHHPHSLDNPTPIVDFLLKHADDSANCPPSTVVAAPNLETDYVKAGWKGNPWARQHTDGSIATLQPKTKVVLLGDSLAQGFGGFRREVDAPGETARKKWLDSFGVANQGISTDKTQNVLFRIQTNALSSPDTKVILVQLGAEHYGDDSPEDVALGIEAVAKLAQKDVKKSVILVQPLLPFGKTKNDPRRVWSEAINDRLRKMAKKGSIRLAVDGYPTMMEKDGKQRDGLFEADQFHLTPAGYEVWGQTLNGVLKKFFR